ncbi:PAS domain S-box protein [Fulvimarina sp. 2208YS6-2-32]|uniref:hybrid sensor histidine kinase/response regulator n=1 Tax=Fulvimarina uroteuthidis TaxID=3098149 RepID=UPI003A101EAB
MVLAERRETEANNRQRLFLQQMPGFVAVLAGPDHRYEYVNDSHIALFGSRDFIGMPIRQASPERVRQGFVERLDSVYATGEPFRGSEIPIQIGKDGSEHFVDLLFQPIRHENGQITGIFIGGYDVTQRVEAQRALKESEMRLLDLNRTLEERVAERTAERDRLWTLSEDMLARADFSGMMTAVSPSWTRVLGWPEAELLKRPYASFMHPDDEAPTLAGLARMGETMRPTRFENRISTRDGQWKPIEWTVAPEEDGVNFIAVGRDLNTVKAQDAELAAVQDALRQSQKMEAVGQLTGGLAHDFNNLLAGISGSLEMMQTRIAQGRVDEIERYMVGAQGAAKRAAALTHRLLAFSRRQTLAPKPTDVNRLVEGMVELIERTVGPQIEVRFVTNAGLSTTLVDAPQLENALLNLCINARDAMPDGGRITIETANTWFDDQVARQQDLPAGEYVSMCVSDTGTGMTSDVIEKAFDPFFTTKPIGVGTGLGLSMIYGFVRQSGGQVRIRSKIDTGSTVCIYLPAHMTAAVDEIEVAKEIPQPSGAGETVLVIDDEPLVRMLIVDVVEDLGYAAIEAADGPQGMKILNSDTKIDLLVTDVGLPNGMNGRQVADAARERRPGLKVLFVTGYAENAVLNQGQLDMGMDVVTKPFDMDALAAKITAMIKTNA